MLLSLLSAHAVAPGVSLSLSIFAFLSFSLPAQPLLPSYHSQPLSLSVFRIILASLTMRLCMERPPGTPCCPEPNSTPDLREVSRERVDVGTVDAVVRLEQ